MKSRKSSRPKPGKTAARAKPQKSVKLLKKPAKSLKTGEMIISHHSFIPAASPHPLRALPDHIVKLLVPTSAPIPSPPSSTSQSAAANNSATSRPSFAASNSIVTRPSAAVNNSATTNSSSPAISSTSIRTSTPQTMSDEQTWQMLALGQKCYSFVGQTRLFWSKLQPPLADHEWLRFHFLQSSMLSTLFLALYALLGLGIIFDIFGPGLIMFGLIEVLSVLVVIIHFVLFHTLGKKAAKGEVVMVPFIGPQAAMLAASGKPLQAWKL